jgi:undecaprenyl-diphosphatase
MEASFNALHLLFLAVLQGVTELFPISSLGHSVLIPALFNWPLDRDGSWFLPFVVVLHLGTAAALLLYFWRDWADILGGVWRSRGRLVDPTTRLFWLIAMASIPAGLLGLLLEHEIRLLFGGFVVVAVFLILNGLMLMWGDRLKEQKPHRTLDNLTWTEALRIGIAQSLALIPGLSRSGLTLVAGVAAGLDYQASARFSFLLATPVIAAAGMLEVPKLLSVAGKGSAPLGLILGAGLLAGAFAYLSTWFLMRYFKGHEVTALRPFGMYCLALGGAALLLHWV